MYCKNVSFIGVLPFMKKSILILIMSRYRNECGKQDITSHTLYTLTHYLLLHVVIVNYEGNNQESPAFSIYSTQVCHLTCSTEELLTD